MNSNEESLRIDPKRFIIYKFLNSIFLGLSIGAVIVIYRPIEPKFFSIGGILLAIGMLVIAQLYTRILTIKWFYRITLTVESIVLFAIVYLLLHGVDLTGALVYYIALQLTFVFGNYLLRLETLLLNNSATLKHLDTAKQFGYLTGMTSAYLIYEALERFKITDRVEQTLYMHNVLVLLQITIILQAYLSFRKK